jgi:hypothetical protein
MDNKAIGTGVFMKNQGLKSFFVTTILLLSSLQAFAGFGFEGYLADANGNPISGSVVVHLKVLSPGAEACPLYMEDQTLTVPADGYVSLVIGNGTRTDTLPHTLDRAFANYAAFSSLTGCAIGSTYSPVAGAKRLLNVSVTVGGTTETLGSLDINPVPVAMNAEKVGAHAMGSLVRVESAGVPSAATALTPTDFTNLQALIGGTSTLYAKNSAAGSVLPSFASNPGSPAAGNMWYDSTTHQVKFYDGTVVQPLGSGGGGIASVSAIAPLTAVAVSSAVTISMPAASAGTNGYLSSTDWTNFNSKVGIGTTFAGDVSGAYNALNLIPTGVTPGTYTKVTVDLKGRVTSATTISGPDITTALGYTPLNKTGDAMTGILGLYSTSVDPSTGGWAAPDKGKTWFNSTTNQIKYWDGSSIQVLGVAGAGLANLNGQSGSTQTFSAITDNSVVMPTISSASNVHTFKFPQASVGGVTNGLVSNTDYNNWNNKLDNSSAFAGDLSGTFTAANVNRLQGYNLFISAPTLGQVLRYNGSNWNNSSIDANDIMTGYLPVNHGGTGASSFPANRIVATNGTGNAMQPFTCSLNQVITFDASGNAVCSNVNGLLPPIVQVGGNSNAANIVVGTNDAFSLALRSSGTDRILINQSGQVGIMSTQIGLGTASPTAPVDVTGYVMMRGQPSASASVASQGNFFFNSTKNKFQFSEGTGPFFDLLSPNGNAMGQSINFGTMDSYKVNLMTNNQPRVTIDQTGSVGIGTMIPTAGVALDISSPSSSYALKVSQGMYQGMPIKSISHFTAAGGSCSPSGTLASGAGTSCMFSSYNAAFSSVTSSVTCTPSGGGAMSKFLVSCLFDGSSLVINALNLSGVSNTPPTSYEVTVINF